MSAHEPVGMIGLGLLGSAVAERLLAAGHEVVGYDVEPAARQRLEQSGGRPVESPRELVHCRRIVLALPDSDVVGQVVDELRPALGVDTLLIDLTTGDPTVTALLGEELAGYHLGYVDATVLGSSELVRSGGAILLLGGERRQTSEAETLLQPIHTRAFHLGQCGRGARMKLAVNLVLGLQRAVLAEGLAFATALGFDPAQTLEVFQSGPAASAVMESKGRKMITREFSPQARLRQHLKDVRLILEAARREELDLPLSEAHRQLLEDLVNRGFGDEDNSAVIRHYD